MFDLAESTELSIAARVVQDNSTVTDICAALNIKSAGSYSYRIGKYSTVSLKPPPLKIVFNNPMYVDQLIQNQVLT